MNNQIIKFDGTKLDNINVIEDICTHINDTLARYEATKNVRLSWQAPTDKSEAQSLTKLVSASQDSRGMENVSKDGKAKRKAEFQAVHAVFVTEGINDLIEAALRKFGYQPRFQGSAKNGTATMKFVPKDLAAKDKIGKQAVELQSETKSANMLKFFKERGYTQDQIARIQNGDVIEIESEVVTNNE